MEKIVIALGGNALQSGNSGATAEAQLEVVKRHVSTSQKSAARVMISAWFTVTVHRLAEFC